MQTFITSFNQAETAKSLDNKRLGKQRVEAIQIAECLLIKESRWKNHPAVKMWKGYEEYLLYTYISWIMDQWIRRGFKNEKCFERYLNLTTVCEYPGYTEIKSPAWLTKEFILAHKSNLIRKNPTYYRPLFGNIPDNLPYIWPVK